MQLFARLLWTLVRTFNEADAGREWERERERERWFATHAAVFSCVDCECCRQAAPGRHGTHTCRTRGRAANCELNRHNILIPKHSLPWLPTLKVPCLWLVTKELTVCTVFAVQTVSSFVTSHKHGTFRVGSDGRERFGLPGSVRV